MLWPNGARHQPTVTFGFGLRKAPTPGASTNHKGADFIGFTYIRAVAAGTVSKVGTPVGWAGGGTQIWIEHEGFLARYLHLAKDSPKVKVGDKVTEGQHIGTMGKTGVASGVHLHLEIVVGGKQIDPVAFLAARIGKLTIDGIYGAQTEAALGLRMNELRIPGATVQRQWQNYLNSRGVTDWQKKSLKVDGIAFRTNLKHRVPRAGRWRTIWATQAYLGTPRDGALSKGSSTVIRELQIALNKGSIK